ncbi:WXG100 family type VII secretion target [Corynebacterium yudongzhengii]|uniref:ESAT-6-like protein n=1 Tax=Corynebacterium yudongzhengii TaxID=2080740 RepID=A0A2U1T9Z2_9CORY|nr:WXG100 family type VII secretion target [Corynebacterium yudongzhengii]AWB81287.1 WXG100 family type VII secretion target [Corynebacterium yudongzhengii]PWC02826.1 WXG100 family type VII secretion target [Corynebacterium yudongzhengii]
MSQIKYQFGEIEAGSADIQNTSARIAGELDDLKRQLQPMIEAWEGDSAAAYQAAQAQWDAAAAELNTILSTISTTLAEGNANMSDINRRAAASWQ